VARGGVRAEEGKADDRAQAVGRIERQAPGVGGDRFGAPSGRCTPLAQQEMPFRPFGGQLNGLFEQGNCRVALACLVERTGVFQPAVGQKISGCHDGGFGRRGRCPYTLLDPGGELPGVD
jgi:hypothetical protein